MESMCSLASASAPGDATSDAEVFAHYQATMRRFLETQEAVMKAFGRGMLEESLAAAWELLKPFPPESVKRIPRALLDRLA